MTKETILVVEDDTNIARLLEVSLRESGYNVLMALRGEHALEICREHHVDLIVLDIRLPDISGYEVGVALRQAPQTESIPIIVLTAFTERQDKLDAYRLVRAEQFLGKPFDVEELLSVIRVHLDRSQRQAQYHPITDLPTGELLNDQLRGLLPRTDWTMALLRINGFESFTQYYGAVVGENVLKFTAHCLRDAVQAEGDTSAFVGQMVVGPYFVLISQPTLIETVAAHVISVFDRDIRLHYDYRDRARGFIEISDVSGTPHRYPQMTLSVAVLSAFDGPFRDIRELTESGERLLQEALFVAKDRQPGSAIVHGRKG